ncbi:ArsR/SmtB family transcription factor [Butyrivibrio sp. JL13D10]|uniref:ArsR/SmtB family transcription factor n=1 Tax=Butyrivibrio sp. JL13D10 TaxID=3236815 RepID=UPI0038B58223
MAKNVYLNLGKPDELTAVGRALSVPIRAQILSIIAKEQMSIADIARELKIPASSCASHIKALQEANLVRMEQIPGTRGSIKMCSRNVDRIDIRLVEPTENVDDVLRVEMPIGAYTDCHVYETCGLADENGLISMDDREENFYLPERINAKILWSSRGYVEYSFPNQIFSLPFVAKLNRISISAEICSEAPGFNLDWKSDITLWINGIECGTWTCDGDYGERMGLNNPAYWPKGRTQYGELTSWEVTGKGTYINQKRIGDLTIEELGIMNSHRITVRFGNKENAKHIGGFNIFGKEFGDYKQDIVMGLAYEYAGGKSKSEA